MGAAGCGGMAGTSDSSFGASVVPVAVRVRFPVAASLLCWGHAIAFLLDRLSFTPGVPETRVRHEGRRRRGGRRHDRPDDGLAARTKRTVGGPARTRAM